MKIKIIKCTKETYWYSNKVGEIYTVSRAVTYPHNKEKGYQVIGGTFQSSYVNLEDAEIVFEEIK
jgi:hypothetical protein